MKTEQRKKEDCKLLDAFLGLTKANPLRMLEEDLDKFKADNDLLPKQKNKSGWYLSKLNPKSMLYLDFEKNVNYGIDYIGMWIDEGGCSAETMSNTHNTPVTEAEVLEKLSAMAVKMGYVEGVEVEIEHKGKTHNHTLYGEIFISCMGELSMFENESKAGYITLMQNGKWAKIITPNLELSSEEWNERIGKVQVKINELEEKLNELRKLV